MYQALQRAYEELKDTPVDHPLTEKMVVLLRNGFSDAVKNLNQAAVSSKTEQDSKVIQKLCEGMMAGERIINHIWNKQAKF